MSLQIHNDAEYEREERSSSVILHVSRWAVLLSEVAWGVIILRLSHFRSCLGQWPLVSFALIRRQCSSRSAKAEFVQETKIPSLGKLPFVAYGKSNEYLIERHFFKLCASESPDVLFTNADSWAHRQILIPQSVFSGVWIPTWWTSVIYLRNTKLVRVLTSKEKHLFLELLDKKNIL